MAKSLTNAQNYVKMKRDTDAAWSNLTAEERAEAEIGLAWLEAMGEVYVGAKRRGRPPGSANRTAEISAPLPLAESEPSST